LLVSVAAHSFSATISKTQPLAWYSASCALPALLLLLPQVHAPGAEALATVGPNSCRPPNLDHQPTLTFGSRALPALPVLLLLLAQVRPPSVEALVSLAAHSFISHP
jgi:hypothetical protein